MFRKLILPMLATAMLAGCATDYNYRGGNGDYYYGQPRVEYRYQGYGGFNDGYYGGVGFGYGYGSGSFGYGSRAYYDPFGRLVYGYPGGYRYGNDWYRSRTHRDHDERDHDGHDGHDGHSRDDGDDRNQDADNHQDRRPPWRNLGGLQGRDVDNLSRDDDGRQPLMQRERARAYPVTAPQGQQRVQQRSEPSAPPVFFRQHSEMSPSIGGATRGVRGGRSKIPVDADE